MWVFPMSSNKSTADVGGDGTGRKAGRPFREIRGPPPTRAYVPQRSFLSTNRKYFFESYWFSCYTSTLGSIATEGLKKEKRIKKEEIIPTIDSKCSPKNSITN